MISYLDTSILVAYYCPEPLSDRAERVILGLQEPAVSVLSEVELVSAIARKVREKGLSRENANRILKEFQFHLSQSFYRRIPILQEHFHTAFGWLSQFRVPLRTLDALHLAIAATNSQELITADRLLSRSARKLGVPFKFLK